MSWQSNLKGDSLSWLLEGDEPAVRRQALVHLLDLPVDDPQVKEAAHRSYKEGQIAAVLDAMDPAGWWVKPGPGYTPKYRSTDWAVIMLAQMGATASNERVARACAYVLDHAMAPGGLFSYNGTPSGTVDCLQGNLCWALTELGFNDPRLEQAFEWMARTVTGEGLAGNDQSDAPMRYYAYKCGPDFACGANGKKACAWGAAKVMLAFSRLPAERRTPLIERAIRRGIDFLFSVEPSTAAYPTRTNSKPSRNWWKFGFPVFYNTDIMQIAESLAVLGYGRDARLANTMAFILEKQDNDGRWPLEYDYTEKTWAGFGEQGQPNKWVTLRALRVLKQAYR